jgi:hypothetical protein
MKKKDKIIWVDDGRTVADMSAVGGKRSAPSKPAACHSPVKEQLCTLLDAMGFMLLPAMAVLGILAAAFLIVYFLL